MLVFTAVHREREAGRLGELSQARHDAVDLERGASATWSTSSFTVPRPAALAGRAVRSGAIEIERAITDRAKFN